MVLLEALRQGTSTIHEALHDHPFMHERFFAHMTRPSYEGFLHVFLARWHVLERSLAHHADAHPDVKWLHLRIAPRLPVLYDDLDGREVDLPDVILSPAHCVGHAYTLVGSSMGSKVLVKEVTRQLPDAPIRYMSGVGDSREWRDLVGFFSTLEVTDARRREIVEGAVECFEEVDAAFRRLVSTPS